MPNDPLQKTSGYQLEASTLVCGWVAILPGIMSGVWESYEQASERSPICRFLKWDGDKVIDITDAHIEKETSLWIELGWPGSASDPAPGEWRSLKYSGGRWYGVPPTTLQLLPCPKCGSRASIVWGAPQGMAGSALAKAHIQCTKCGLQGQSISEPWNAEDYDVEELLIKDWNQRA